MTLQNLNRILDKYELQLGSTNVQQFELLKELPFYNWQKQPQLLPSGNYGLQQLPIPIVAGGRVDLYFNGGWTSISWDNIEDLSNSGTDGIMIEKIEMARIFCDFVDPYGFAIINTRGFFVDYLDYVSEQSIDK